MKRKIIFLTGGSGFIGKNFIQTFSKKYKILAPTHKQLDLLDQKKVLNFFKKNSIDCVVHAAMIGGSRMDKNVPDVISVNVRMFLVLFSCKKYYKKMITFGSGAEYDTRRDLRSIKENDFGKMIPIDNYGISKYICSLITQNEKKITVLRLFGVYGKFEEYQTRFISNTICKAVLNLPMTIKRNAVLDYLYVEDFLKILDYFISNKSTYNVYNLGRGKKRNLLGIAKKIQKISGKKLPIIIEKKSMNKEYTCDTSRLRKEIKNLEFTAFDKSLKDLFEYYLSIRSDLNKKTFFKNI